jgi:spoIIIJ-associated protein
MATTKANSEINQRIQQRLEDVFKYFAVKPEVTIVLEDDVSIVEVKTNQDDLFVGKSPDPLLALQHLLRLMVQHDFPQDHPNLSLNIGGFHQQQKARLEQIAQTAATQARETKTAVYLEPMSSFERRLIHLALVNEPGVVSESTGMGASRRVVVKADES